MHGLVLLKSVFLLIFSIYLTTLLPSTYIGHGGGPPAKVGLPNEISISLQVPVLREERISYPYVLQAHSEFLLRLCENLGEKSGSSDTHRQVAEWFLEMLLVEGLEGEILHVGGREGVVVHSVLRGGSGAAGISSIVFASPLPEMFSDLGAVCTESQNSTPPSTPHGAFTILALARTLRGVPWRAADYVFVLYSDAVGAGSGGMPSLPPPAPGPLGQLGAAHGSGNKPPWRSAHWSRALSLWATLVTNYDPWRVNWEISLQDSWRSCNFLTWMRLLVGGSAYLLGPSSAQYVVSHPPLRSPIPPIVAAIVLDFPASASSSVPPQSTSWGVLTQGPGGAQADLDLFSTLRHTQPKSLQMRSRSSDGWGRRWWSLEDDARGKGRGGGPSLLSKVFSGGSPQQQQHEGVFGLGYPLLHCLHSPLTCRLCCRLPYSIL